MVPPTPDDDDDDENSGCVSVVLGGGGPAVKFARRVSLGVVMAGGWMGAGGGGGGGGGAGCERCGLLVVAPALGLLLLMLLLFLLSALRGPKSWVMTAAAPIVPPWEAERARTEGGVGWGRPGPEPELAPSRGSQPQARLSSRCTRLRFQPVWW